MLEKLKKVPAWVYVAVIFGITAVIVLIVGSRSGSANPASNPVFGGGGGGSSGGGSSDSSTLNDLNNQIASLEAQLNTVTANDTSTINSLNAEIAALQAQINSLTTQPPPAPTPAPAPAPTPAPAPYVPPGSTVGTDTPPANNTEGNPGVVGSANTYGTPSPTPTPTPTPTGSSGGIANNPDAGTTTTESNGTIGAAHF